MNNDITFINDNNNDDVIKPIDNNLDKVVNNQSNNVNNVQDDNITFPDWDLTPPFDSIDRSELS